MPIPFAGILVPLAGPLITFGTFLLGIFTKFRSWFGFWFITHIGDLAIGALYSVGAGWATYELGSFALTAIYNEILSNVSGMPEMLLVSINTMGMFEFLPIVFGGFSASLVLRGVVGGISASKFSMRKPENWVT
ncbi:hypothetical protein IDAT_01065 [Pseudidiomarina atlantica]|uniref:Uncharacterized protein n=2 Tax=Pseudidiomarina atlantica TaxID=1517416 RepID=A0A094IV78_9GAMM|nr:hypothetical protein IDAT_01065 [Pseudidiomarina atlantica]